MLNVAIAIDSPTDYGPRAVQVIVAACEEVIGEQRCPAAIELEPGMVTAWYAVVHPNDPTLGSVRIEFRDRNASGTLIDERSITFERSASQQSRLTSIGSVIAALAAAREGGPIPPRARVEAPKPPAAAPPPASPPRDVAVGLAAFASPALAGGPYRFGAFADAHLGLGGRPFALAAGRYAIHPESPQFSWISLSAGLGLRLAAPRSPFDLELTGEFVLEHTRAQVEHEGEEASASQVGWGGRAGMRGVWSASPHWGLVAGVDATWVTPRIHVTVEGREVAEVPIVAVALSAGVRFQL